MFLYRGDGGSWSFELMAITDTSEPVWSVSEVNAAVRDLVENSLMAFWISGEVGTMKIYQSGHV